MPVEAIDTPIEDAIEQMAAATTEAMGEVKELRDRLEKMEAKSRRPGAGVSPFAANDNRPFNTQAANDNTASLVEEKKALADYVRHNAEIKAMSASSSPDGGYGVTPQLSDQIAKRLYDQSPMRQLARVVEVGNFDSFEEPYQVGDAAATWVGENAARPATATPTLGLLNVPVNELYATQPVTQRLLDDSRFDMAGFIVERASDRFARTEGTAFVRGNGVGQPMGFMSYATDSAADFTRAPSKIQFVASGSGSAITFDGLRSLFWTMRAPHRTNAAWVMSSGTASQIDTIKDLEGRYVWRDSATAGAPPTLLGKPVYFDENMDSVSAGTFPIAFANWRRAYVVADKPGVRWLRDPYSSKPSVIFYAYKRTGGGVADFDAIKLLKVSA